ncbi:hypothetical protein [Clostridium perfringens]|uniref:hypothetical protein n=1 Tax=Clostridium perfringens TaxID=1502 RepID=UPI0024BD1147|nr:hypothetical protein [Clostridium perfringens]
MNLIIFLIIVLAILATLFSTIIHLTHIYSISGFKNENHFMYTLVFFGVYNSIFVNAFTSALYEKFSNIHSILFLSFHIALFFVTYLYTVLTIVALKWISIGIKKVKFIKVDLFPLEYPFLYHKLYKNTKLLKKILIFSYLISILIFAFFVKDYLLNLATDTTINIDVFKDNLKDYTQVFLISLIPIIYASLKK